LAPTTGAGRDRNRRPGVGRLLFQLPTSGIRSPPGRCLDFDIPRHLPWLPVNRDALDIVGRDGTLTSDMPNLVRPRRPSRSRFKCDNREFGVETEALPIFKPAISSAPLWDPSPPSPKGRPRQMNVRGRRSSPSDQTAPRQAPSGNLARPIGEGKLTTRRT